MIQQLAVLTYRNLLNSFEKVFIMWQVVVPITEIFVAGIAFSVIVNEPMSTVTGTVIPYTAFFASGVMAYNTLSTSTMVGNVIWRDKRNGMFQQIMVMPISNMNYILSMITTMVLLGFGGAAVVLIAGYPLLVGYMDITFAGALYIIYALVISSILFGSIAIIMGILLRGIESFNVVFYSVFQFFIPTISILSYPLSDQLPYALKVAFLYNPFTYIIELIRAGMFNDITATTHFAATITAVLAGVYLYLAFLVMSNKGGETIS